MKTWITYPAAIVLGFSAHLLLGGMPAYETVLDLVVPLAKQIGIFMVFPIVFVMLSGATASLRRFKEGPIVLFSTLFWGLFTTLALSFGGMGLTLVPLPSFVQYSFPPAAAPNLSFFDFSAFRSLFIADNAFVQFSASSVSLLPVIVIALLVGIAMRPNKEIIRPAYVVLNSFSEVMGRLARLFTSFGALLMLFISADWFRTPGLLQTAMDSKWYVASLMAGLLATLLILLPLLFALFTGFRGGNPYRMTFGSIGAYLASGVTGSLLFGTNALLALSLQNSKARKRVVGFNVPLLTLIGRGGSALVATFSVITLLQSTGAALDIKARIFIALFSGLFSLVCSLSPGVEVPFISIMVLKGIGLEYASTAVVGVMVVLLPLIQLASLYIDAAVIAFGSAYSSRIVSPDDRKLRGQTL
ncbi:MAG: cation:dicarboxylate symporter family transporter [Sphaerochaetaceae bacterium]